MGTHTQWIQTADIFGMLLVQKENLAKLQKAALMMRVFRAGEAIPCSLNCIPPIVSY